MIRNILIRLFVICPLYLLLFICVGTLIPMVIYYVFTGDNIIELFGEWIDNIEFRLD